ncbi:MAG: response regulator transcription factor [Sphaerochaetaceae bacterium]|nr:response regulator transcription factor [Sphaerochaetaceae bacterium]
MIRVTIVDDHILVREGIRTICSKTQDIRVMHDFSGWDTLSEHLTVLDTTDVLILDISLARIDGIQILNELKEQRKNHPPVLFLTLHSEKDFAQSAFRAGAKGYVTKDAESSLIIEAIRIVSAGGYYISDEGSRHVIGDGDSMLPAQDDLSILSAQEHEVLNMICKGMTGKEIAFELNINEKTVWTYKGRIMKKLGFETTVELIRFGLRNGL